MRPIRTRITMGFAGAFIASLFVFAVAVLVARRDAAIDEITERAHMEVEETVRLIDRRSGAGDDFAKVEEDSLAAPGVSKPMERILNALDDYVIILDADGEELYSSPRINALESFEDRASLINAAKAMTDTAQTAKVYLGFVRDEVILAMRDRELQGASAIDRVFVGLSSAPATLAPRQLVGTMLFFGPLLILASVWWAYVIAGRAFSPIDRMVTQVKDITDGRSLHRRLAIGSAGSELVRLAVTLNEMIERLETSFGALRRFTADASHELKTPLTVLRADVERAMSPSTRKDERAVALEEALEQVTRMAELVNSLLTLARADEGRLEVVQDLIALDDLTREVVETARLLGEEAGLRIEVEHLETATVRGDLVRLRQLFLNLVTNAIKYTTRGGEVCISLSRVGEQAHFTVKDTGIGIAAADLPYVFDRFWRADRSRSRTVERSGFGLGLAISQWIAHAHGGSLSVQSRLGRGSSFTVQLPISDPGSPLKPESVTSVRVGALPDVVEAA